MRTREGSAPSSSSTSTCRSAKLTAVRDDRGARLPRRARGGPNAARAHPDSQLVSHQLRHIVEVTLGEVGQDLVLGPEPRAAHDVHAAVARPDRVQLRITAKAYPGAVDDRPAPGALEVDQVL